MAGSNTLALAAGGLVIVALSFGAGLLGASVGTPDARDVAPAPRTVPDSVVRGRLDELDRRVGNVEERLRVVEDTANAALNRVQEIDAIRRELAALRSGDAALPRAAPAAPTDVAPPEAVEAGDGDGSTSQQMTAEERDALEAVQREKMRQQAREIVSKHAPSLLRQRLTRIGDATAQGEADRRSQIYAETKQLAVQYNMTPQEEDRVREILVETSEDSVKEIAPYLGGGLERADFSAIKERLFAIWDARDAKMAEILDEKELEEYRETQKQWREVYGKALDDMDATRRSR